MICGTVQNYSLLTVSKMIYKFVFLLLTLAVTIHCGPKPKKNHIIPISLIEDATEGLQELDGTVQEKIQSAEREIDSAKSTYNVHVTEVESETKVKIDEEAENVEGLVNDIRTMAEAAHINVDSCLNERESYLRNLPSYTFTQFGSCVSNATSKIDEQIQNSLNAVKVTKNTIDGLYAQLSECTTGSIYCVSPIINATGKAKVELPETIDKEVNTVLDLVKSLTPEVDGCKDINLKKFDETSTSVLDAINDCVDAL